MSHGMRQWCSEMQELFIPLPPPVAAALQRLHANGFHAHIVGGCVRDALLGKAPHDWDLTTSAHPRDIERCFQGVHVIETGLQHGTVTVVVEGMPLEITTYRIDGTYSDHRRPDHVTFTGNLRDDLARRDFTVNAMAYDPNAGVIDPFGGQQDLARRRIACVGDPAARFAEDGLRILRAMRFAAVLDFSIAPETADAMHRQRELLHHISAERIFVELTKLLCGIGATRILRAYADILFTILPRLRPMAGFDQQNPHHCYDVWEHTLHVIDAVPPEPILRWSALLHDSGKPAVFTKDMRGGHFYGHATVSTEIARDALTTLKSDRQTLETVCRLVTLHDTVIAADERRVKRLVHRLGFSETRQLLLLHKGDVSAQAYCHRAERIRESDALLSMLDALEAADACLSLKKMAISGGDLLALGLPQGKQIGACLQDLLEQVMDGNLPNEHAPLCSAAREWIAAHEPFANSNSARP